MIFHMMGGMNIHLPAIWVFRVCTRLLTHSQMIPDAVGRAPEVIIPTPVSMTRRIWICLFVLGCLAAWVAVWILGPTSSISMGFSIINHPAFGVPPWLWKPPKTSNVSAPCSKLWHVFLTFLGFPWHFWTCKLQFLTFGGSSGKQTWQWKIHHLWMIFPFQ